MKNCKSCGAAFDEKANFCPNCGEKVEESQETNQAVEKVQLKESEINNKESQKATETEAKRKKKYVLPVILVLLTTMVAFSFSGIFIWNKFFRQPKIVVKAEAFAKEMNWVNEKGYMAFQDEDTELYGIANENGKIILEPSYYRMSNFNDFGVAIFQVENGDDLGLISEKGKVLKDSFAYDLVDYSSLDSTLNDFLSVDSGPIIRYVTEKYGDANLINSKGKVIKENIDGYVQGFSPSGIAPFEDEDGYWGIMNDKGKIIIEPTLEFEHITPFGSNGLAFFQDENEQWGIIDEKGKIVKKRVKSTASFVYPFDEKGYAYFYDFSSDELSVSIVNEKGDVVVEDMLQYSSPTKEGVYTYAESKGSYDTILGIKNLEGETIKEAFAYYITNFNERGLALYQKEEGDKWGIINVKGEIVVEPEFEAETITYFNKNGVAVYKDSETGLYGTLKID